MSHSIRVLAATLVIAGAGPFSVSAQGASLTQRLDSIAGMVPDPFHLPGGCTFHPRCPSFMEGVCDRQVPPK